MSKPFTPLSSYIKHALFVIITRLIWGTALMVLLRRCVAFFHKNWKTPVQDALRDFGEITPWLHSFSSRTVEVRRTGGRMIFSWESLRQYPTSFDVSFHLPSMSKNLNSMWYVTGALESDTIRHEMTSQCHFWWCLLISKEKF